MKRKVWKYIGYSILLVLGIGIGFGIGHYSIKPVVGSEVRLGNSDFPYINPILLAELGSKDQFPQYKPLNKEVQNYINQALADKKATSISFYFRDLNSGSWTGINENETYAPASMLKVALMIAYLSQAEKDPAFLDKKVVYTGTEDEIQYFKPQTTLVQGKKYSIRELIVAMIVNSDNISNQLLLNNIDSSVLAKVYTELGLSLPTKDTVDFLSAKSYSALFRTLYSSTYLNRQHSSDALGLLAQAEFKNGLVAGVPQGTAVAHKFGERTEQVNGVDAGRELHDCGVVYYKYYPYFACVMTKGSSFDDLQKIIQDISAITYKAVDKLATSQ